MKLCLASYEEGVQMNETEINGRAQNRWSRICVSYFALPFLEA